MYSNSLKMVLFTSNFTIHDTHIIQSCGMKWHLAVQVVKKKQKTSLYHQSPQLTSHTVETIQNIQSPLKILIYNLMRLTFLFRSCTSAPSFLLPDVYNKYDIMNFYSLNLKLALIDTPRVHLTKSVT